MVLNISLKELTKVICPTEEATCKDFKAVGLCSKFNSFAPNCTAPDVTIIKLNPFCLCSFIEDARELIKSLFNSPSLIIEVVPIFKTIFFLLFIFKLRII